MTEYMDKLEDRMVELTESLQKKLIDPDYNFDEVKAVDMVIKFEIYLNDKEDDGTVDGLYLYLDENGVIIDAEYFVKDDDEVTIMSFTDEQLEIVIGLFRNVFTINVE